VDNLLADHAREANGAPRQGDLSKHLIP